MDLQTAIIQGIGLIGTALFFISFQFRKNKTLFRVQFLSYLCYTLHLLLLGALTGAVSYLINLIRSFCLGSRFEFLKGRVMCLILCLMQIAALIFTWSGVLSLLPVIANIASTIGGYTRNPRKVRIAGMFVNSPLWIIYDIFVGSFAGILDEVVSESSMILSVIRFGWKDLDHIED